MKIKRLSNGKYEVELHHIVIGVADTYEEAVALGLAKLGDR